MNVLRAVSAVAAISVACAAMGQQKLEVGSAAPGLDIEEWVKGSETTIAPGNVYVVEFWATWCVPCKKSIPHLTELQKEFGEDGLTIIGVSDEEVDKVRPFVKSMGDKMAYNVAVDRRQSTTRAWMNAAGQNGIPAAFIVDREGEVAFIGNPHPDAGGDFERVLRLVMAGRYDPKLQASAEPLLKAARQARKVKNWRVALKHYDEVIALDARVFAPIAIERFDMVLRDMGDKTEAYTYAQSLVTKFSADPAALQMLSEKIATDPQIPKTDRNLEVAMAAAQASQASAGPRDANSLAAVAQVYFVQGEITKAVELQKEAYFNASPRKKPEFKRTLTTYQEASQRSASVKTKPDAPAAKP